MEELLIINKTQFGYHTDYYKYCQYLKSDFDITYLSFDTGHKEFKMEGVKTVYVPWKGPKIFRGILFILYCLIMLIKHHGLTFVHYFEFCEFLKINFPVKKMNLDVRTLSVHEEEEFRVTYNARLKKACAFFDHVTVISKGVQKKLNLNNVQSTILPLGADVISETIKDFSNLKMLYVGTLNGRNISETIEGLKFFIENSEYNGEISYDIVGDGSEKERLHHLVEKLNLQNIVTLHGRVPNFELKPFFDTCNIGVSYIPMTDYYDHQPSTKTFEYILSGLVCIATKTYANKSLINSKNGVLHKDTPSSFSKALQKVVCNRKRWKSENIRTTLEDHTWENIVNTKLFRVIKENQVP